MLYTHSGLWADFLLSIVLLIPLSVSFLISFLLPDIQVCFSTLDDAGEKIISPVASCTWVLTQCTSIPLWDRLLSFDGSAWCIVVLGKKSSISKVLPTVSSTSKLIFFPSSSMLEFLLRRAGLPQVSFIHGYCSQSRISSQFQEFHIHLCSIFRMILIFLAMPSFPIPISPMIQPLQTENYISPN